MFRSLPPLSVKAPFKFMYILGFLLLSLGLGSIRSRGGRPMLRPDRAVLVLIICAQVRAAGAHGASLQESMSR